MKNRVIPYKIFENIKSKDIKDIERILSDLGEEDQKDVKEILQILDRIKNKQKKSLTWEQSNFLDEGTRGRWEFDEQEGKVNIIGDFFVSGTYYKDFFGIRFGKVTGNFEFSDSELISLNGAPEVVMGNFICEGNRLTSLEGGPISVKGKYSCAQNKLASLKGCPEIIEGDFSIYNNQIKNFEGGPKEVGGFFDASDNLLNTLEGAPLRLGGPIKEDEVSINSFQFDDNPISAEILDLIYSKILTGIPYLVAISMLKKDMSKEDWENLDKTGLSPDLEKGGNVLGRFGI